MFWIYMLFALIAGSLMPVQAGVNAQLARFAGHPVLAALVSFMVGTLGLLVYSLFLRASWPTLADLSAAPGWLWVGGLMGAFFVATAAAFAPRLGAATFISITVAAQMITSVVLDQYGLLGFQVRQTSGWRIVGAILLIVGVALIRRF